MTLAMAVLLVSAAQVQPQTTPTTQPPPGTETGRRIGSIITAAVDTAFPVIGRIMDIFRPSDPPNAQARKRDVQAAVTTAQTSARTRAYEQLQALQGVANELAVIQAFATAGAAARTNMVNIKHLLTQEPREFGSIDTEWQVAQGYLNDIQALPADQVRAVREQAIRTRCESVRHINRDLGRRITATITRGQRGGADADAAARDLPDLVDRMTTLLEGFDALAAIEVETLRDDIATIARSANAAAGPGDLTSPPLAPNPTLMALVNDKLSEKVLTGLPPLVE